jgi:hypothetical protein
MDGLRLAEFCQGQGKLQEDYIIMRYGIAWLLGVPVSVLVIWWLLTHVV